MEKIGFVGLGVMGLPMAQQLLGAGYTVLGYDRCSDSLKAAEVVGVMPHRGSLAELASCSELLVLMLPNGDIVREVVKGDSTTALVAGLEPGSIILDMSSVSPFQTRELASELEPMGIRIVDAPVSGNVSKARTGQLNVMAGGDADALEYAREALDAMARQILHVGPVGAGHAIKSLNNLLSASGLIAAAEALLIGKKFGLDTRIMLDVINGSTGRNNSTENKIGQFVLSRAFDGGFALGLMAKDVSIAMELARKCGVPSMHSAITRELVEAALSAEARGSDHTAVVRWLEGLAGAKLE